ncbi:hypothetical protein Hanom_Chr15g01413601 [Helianthus anomalus]
MCHRRCDETRRRRRLSMAAEPRRRRCCFCSRQFHGAWFEMVCVHSFKSKCGQQIRYSVQAGLGPVLFGFGSNPVDSVNTRVNSGQQQVNTVNSSQRNCSGSDCGSGFDTMQLGQHCQMY